MARQSKAKAIALLREAQDVIPQLRHQGINSPDLTKWRRDTNIAIQNIFDDSSAYAKDFDGIVSMMILYSEPNDLEKASAILESMIQEIERFWNDEDLTSIASDVPDNRPQNSNEIFVIHGRDNEAKETVARFLQRLGLTPIILHEQPNQGRTIIEKFEQHTQVGFAVALLTPDDVGALKNEEKNLKPRARQNVVFELGYFLGRLGRERVCALTKGNVELPSDYDGVAYISLDDGGWKMDLIRELRNVGFNVDANKAL